MSKQEKVKEVNRKISSLESELRDNREIVAQMKERSRRIESELITLKSELSKLFPKGIKVTDHAVIRYMEREYNIDVESYRQEIEDKLRSVVESGLGATKVQGFVLNGESVITYAPNDKEKY